MEISLFITISKSVEHHWHELMATGEESDFTSKTLGSINTLKLLEANQGWAGSVQAKP